ncbi:MAG: hypothetical protein AAFR96_03215 [Planctomycetota bacterium]
MNRTAILAAALSASATNAQIGFCPDVDLCIRALPTNAEATEWQLVAEFAGSVPAANTGIGAVWADASFSLSGDAPITITDTNPGFSSAIFGGPVITGNGSNFVEFVGLQPGGGLGTPDSSNPLVVMDFTYEGNLFALQGEVFGQNSALFLGNPLEPFGTVLLYQDAAGDPGDLTIAFARIPAPATLAIAPLALLATGRRRK